MEITRKQKAVAYLRVSSKDQEKEGNSIPAQKRIIEDYALKNNFNVVKIFKEAETAKKAGRKEFTKMIEYLQQNNIKIVMVEKTDRLYRNFTDYVELSFEELDLEIHLVKENEILSKNSKSHQKFIHGIKVLMAKNYCDNLSEEVKKGHHEKLLKGIWPSKAPIGYLNRLENHTIVIDPQKAPIIKKAFELSSTGNYSLSLLKKELYKMGLRGVRSSKELSKQSMSSILSNPFYIGEFEWNKKKYKGSHEPLISRELYNAVQFNMGFVTKPKATKRDFVFRGPLKCGHCGSQITAEIKTKRSGNQYTYYHCTNGKGICTNVTYLREESIEEQYINAFNKIHLSEEIIEFTKDVLLQSHQEEKLFRETQIKELTARYKRLDNYIDQAYLDKLDGAIEPDKWESKTSEWKLEQEHITKKFDAFRVANSSYMLEGIRLMEIANSSGKLFPVMILAEKRELISLVLSNPVLIDSTIRYEYKKPFDMFVNMSEVEKWRERRDSNPRPSA